MIPAAFDYRRPTSLAEAARLLAAHADDAKILAGGHSLLPMMKLRLANPTLLTDLVREFQRLPVNVVFLHCYPYHREAGYLASVFPHVHFDLGSALNYLGPSAGRLMAEALELAPFTKQLYSSDAFGLPELYYLGAVLFRNTLGAVLERWIADGECSAADATRIATLIGRENAERIYPLGFDNWKPRH